MDIVIERRIYWNRGVKPAPRQTVEAKSVTKPISRSFETHTHAVAKFVRPLTEHEENTIKQEFLKLNGIFDPLKKDCTRICNLLGKDISVFQVSGYVTKLHKQAIAGELEMRDRQEYLATLQTHRKHWLTYNGEKYDAMRQRANGPKPKFVARPSRNEPAIPRHRMVQ